MKTINRLLICALLIAVVDCQAFEMFIQTGYKNTPDFSKYGFSKSTLIYEQQIYGPKESRDNINKQNLNKVAAIALSGSSDYVILDIEHWLKDWGKKNNVQKLEIIKRYSNTLNELRAVLPGHKFGYYGVVPAWAHWNIIRSEKMLRRWDDENILRKSIIESVDVVYPSLYTYHDNPEEWKSWATLILGKAREIANGRQIIPFIWPHYHQSSQAFKNGAKDLPAEYWRNQMEFLKNNSDGFIIWTGAFGNNGVWNEALPWWIETKKFISDNFPDKFDIPKN